MQERRKCETDFGIHQLSQFDRADRICDAYEKMWLAGERPLLEDFLARAPEVERDQLRRELEAIQSDYQQRQSAKDTPGNRDTILPDNLSQAECGHAIPRRIARYSIERLLGQGGFGRVYLARDERLRRLVAVKVPHARLLARLKNSEIYLAEARILANLDHPHILPVYDVGSTVDCPCFVVSKYIEGRDLATWMKQTRLGYYEAAALVAKVAEALDYAHSRGVVHRDVKPGNILLCSNGLPYVVDFGLALPNTNSAAEELCLGTPAYMSPEQARCDGLPLDLRSDVFSLGVVFYELLAGRRPFHGDSQQELLARVTACDFPPLCQNDEFLPTELERIAYKALAKCPKDRYATAQAFAADLQQFLASTHDGSSDEKEGPPAHATLPQTGRFAAFRPSIVMGGVAVILASVVSIWAASIAFDAHQANLLEVAITSGNSSVTATGAKAPDQTGLAGSTGPSERTAVSEEDFHWPTDAPSPAIAPFDAEQAARYQQDWSEYLGVAMEIDFDLGKDEVGDRVSLTMMLIPPGEFFMGSDEPEQTRVLNQAKVAGDQWTMDRIAGEGPQHRVRITQPFWLGRYEVTFAQFRQFANLAHYTTDAERDGVGGYGIANGRWVQDPRYVWNGTSGEPRSENDPVVYVSWSDANAFCQWLSIREGSVEFGLPSEARWEYACRAGTTTIWQGGDSEGDLVDQAWYGGNSGGRMQPVGQLRPNNFGLYDMQGNVWEWCADRYAVDYFSRSPTNNPAGSQTGSVRVQRGGDWYYGPGRCRSAYRHFGGPSDRSTSLGFRLAASLANPVSR